MTDDQGDDARRSRDEDRLRALEMRLATISRDKRPATPGADKFHSANQAWRMVVELVAGLVIGFAVGFGLDRLMGTTPIMLVVFIFLGFAAGVRTMLRTAAEMGRDPAVAETGKQMPDDDPARHKRG